MAIDTELSFLDYLISKKIDAIAFQKENAAMFNEWKLLFESVHPDSFTTQKKYLLNPIRRKHLLKD
jgi:hypothetical protein